MGHIPGRKVDRWWEKRWIVEFLAVVPPIVAAVVSGVLNVRDADRRNLGWLLIGAAVWLVIASVVKILHARSQDRERSRRDDYEGLNGALHVLHSVVRKHARLGDGPDDRVRLTLHRVVPAPTKKSAPEELEQLLPYLGKSGGGAGRRFSIRSGIIGRAARERVILAASRQSDVYEEIVQELVRDWSYPEEDVHGLRSDRKSWMAVPLIPPGNRAAIAVVYLDSDVRDLFTPELQEVVADACAGIATFLSKVY